jgi:hypothetical protein
MAAVLFPYRTSNWHQQSSKKRFSETKTEYAPCSISLSPVPWRDGSALEHTAAIHHDVLTVTTRFNIRWNLRSAGILSEWTPRQFDFLPSCPSSLSTNPSSQHHVIWEQITHTTPYITAYLSVPGILLGLLTLENGTNWLSWNICNNLPICAV